MAVAFVQAGGLLTFLATDKNFYLPGEPVRISLVKFNLSPQPLTLTYTTSQRYDFSVLAPFGEVWRWSFDRLFIPVVQEVIVQPGQALSYSEVWPQVDNRGLRVPAGFYRIVGWNTFVGFETFPRASVFIRIGA